MVIISAAKNFILAHARERILIMTEINNSEMNQSQDHRKAEPQISDEQCPPKNRYSLRLISSDGEPDTVIPAEAAVRRKISEIILPSAWPKIDSNRVFELVTLFMSSGHVFPIRINTNNLLIGDFDVFEACMALGFDEVECFVFEQVIKWEEDWHETGDGHTCLCALSYRPFVPTTE